MKQLKPINAINKALLNVKPERNEIDKFKKELTLLLDGINEKESEEFHKNLFSDFLKNSYHSPDYFINTKGRNDLVINNGLNVVTLGSIKIDKKHNLLVEMINQWNKNINSLLCQYDFQIQKLKEYILINLRGLNNLKLKDGILQLCKEIVELAFKIYIVRDEEIHYSESRY